MFDRVLNMSINIAAKNVPNNYWWALESKLPRLNIHVFIFSRLVVFCIWFFKHENIFLIRAITRYCNCKKYWFVLLARTLNRISVLLEMFFIYLATVDFFLPEFSSSFSWKLQSYEKENRGKVIITLVYICT